MAPRELTGAEVRQKFLRHIWGLVRYWDGELDARVAQKSSREKLEGLAFSILVTLDGGAGALPGFVVAPDPHPDDKEYHKENGENWWPENHDVDVRCRLDWLHDQFYSERG